MKSAPYSRNSHRGILVILDPFYWYVSLALGRLMKAELLPEQFEFIEDNIRKHRLVQWINLFGTIPLVSRKH